MTIDARFDPVAPLHLGPAEITSYRSEGFVRIRAVLDDSTVEAMRREVLEVAGADEPTKLRQTSDYLAGTTIDRVVNSARLGALADQLLGGPGSLYLPFSVVKTPGGGQFHFHQDNNYTRFDGPGVNIWLALMDMTPENGCLMMAPRSHVEGTLASENAGDGDNHRKVSLTPADFVPVRMAAGDGVAFTRLTVHGSGPNTTSVPRVAYAVQYFRNDATFLHRESGLHKRLIDDSPQAGRIRPLDAASE